MIRIVERNVLSSGKRLREKGIEIGKREIEDVPVIEASPRYAALELAPEPTDVPAIDAANVGAMRDTG